MLTETAPERFSLTEAGALLRLDRPDSMHSFVEMFGDPAMLAAWRELGHAVHTGATTFDRIPAGDVTPLPPPAAFSLLEAEPVA